MNKLEKNEILNYLAEYLISVLEELALVKDNCGFLDGEFWAYIECLEILSMWTGFEKYKINESE